MSELTATEKKGAWLVLLLSVIQLFIVMPFWLGLLFGILWVISAPWWLWVVFFIYGPAHVVGKIIAKLTENVLKNANREKEENKVLNERFINAKPINSDGYASANFH
jgi:hypothetical protein